MIENKVRPYPGLRLQRNCGNNKIYITIAAIRWHVVFYIAITVIRWRVMFYIAENAPHADIGERR